MDRESAGEALAWIAVGLLVAAAIAWRLPYLALPYTSDEIGTTTIAASLWSILASQETGVNPPLLRALNLVASPWDTPWWGRRLALACSVLAVPTGFVAGRRAAGDGGVALFAGVCVAALLAVHPWCVRYGALYRAYAPFSLTLLALLAVLPSVVEGRRRAWPLAALAAVLLPWWHYLGVPVLVGLVAALVASPDSRRAAWVPVVGLAGVLPLAPFVWSHEGRRVAPGEPLEETLRKLTSLGMQPPDWFRETVWDTVGRATDWYPPLGEVMATPFVLALPVALLGWRRLPVGARAAWGGLVALGVSVLVIGRVQYVRPSTIVMVTTLLGPALAGTTALPGSQAARALVAAGWLAWLGPAMPPAAARLQSRVEDERALWTALERLPAWPGPPVPVAVHPVQTLWTVWFHVAHAHPREAPRGPACDGWDPCFEADGRAWVGLATLSSGAEVDGVVVSFDRHRPPDFGSGCDPLDRGIGWRAWACGTVSTALRAPGGGDALDTRPKEIPPP